MTTTKPSGRRWLIAALFGVSVWVTLIGVAVVLEMIVNKPAPRGLQSMGPIPAIFLSALFLGWIPATLVGVVKFRRLKRGDG